MADKQVEDHNAFNRWDCLGAALMLCSFPAVLCVVFDKNIYAAGMWGAVACCVAAGVYLLSFVIKERILGKIVNLVGWGLTITYFFIAYMKIMERVEQTAADPVVEKKEEKPQQNTQPAEQK